MLSLRQVRGAGAGLGATGVRFGETLAILTVGIYATTKMCQLAGFHACASDIEHRGMRNPVSNESVSGPHGSILTLKSSASALQKKVRLSGRGPENDVGPEVEGWSNRVHGQEGMKFLEAQSLQ